MAAGGDEDALCREFFEMCVVKASVGKALSAQEKKLAKTSAVKKMLEGGMGVSKDTVRHVDASVFPKYQDKKTKQVSEDDFMEKMLPEIAAHEAKAKKSTPDEELKKLKSRMAKKCEEEKAGGGKTKDAAVVSRLTDVSGYTGAHKNRFDESGKGKGIDGREDRVDNKGYVAGYKNENTYDKKK